MYGEFALNRPSILYIFQLWENCNYRKSKTRYQQDKHMTNKNESTNQEPSIQAMVWYKEEDWDTLMGLFSDNHLLPKSYSDWLTKAEEMVKKVEGSGDVVMKVFIDPITFPAWCQEKGKEMDSHARTELAIEVATQQSFGPKT